MANTKMSRFSTNVNGYIGKSQKFTSVEAEEYSGVSGSEPALLSAVKSSVDAATIVAATTATTLTTAQSGTTFLVPAVAAALVVTLPTASASTIGVTYKFIWTAAQLADIDLDSVGANIIDIVYSNSTITQVVAGDRVARFDFSVDPQPTGTIAVLTGTTATSWHLEVQTGADTASIVAVA